MAQQHTGMFLTIQLPFEVSLHSGLATDMPTKHTRQAHKASSEILSITHRYFSPHSFS